MRHSKRYIIGALILIFSSASALAVTHEVKKGETLASIANNYKVTVDEIIAINPDAAKYIYVGMDLNIPEPKTVVDKPTVKEEHNSILKSLTTTETERNENRTGDSNMTTSDGYSSSPISSQGSTTDEYFKKHERYGFVLNLGYGFKKGNGIYRASGGVSYQIFPHVRVAGQIGYMGGYSSTGKGSERIELTSNYITFPLSLSYLITGGNEVFGIKPLIAFYPTVCTGGKMKIGGKKYKQDGGGFSMTGSIGAAIELFGFDIGFNYFYNISKSGSYPEIFIGFGF